MLCGLFAVNAILGEWGVAQYDQRAFESIRHGSEKKCVFAREREGHSKP